MTEGKGNKQCETQIAEDQEEEMEQCRQVHETARLFHQEVGEDR